MKELYHQHLLLRAYVKNPPKEEIILNNWLTELVSDIKMVVVVPAKSAYVDTVGNEGLTGSINIQTSHIAIHIWDSLEIPKIEMDVYSCSCFELETILNKVNDWGLLSYHYMMVDRNSVPFKIIDSGDGEKK
jgi:S-adenosylmethionine/arginine decarboxylase-like enzyme